MNGFKSTMSVIFIVSIIYWYYISYVIRLSYPSIIYFLRTLRSIRDVSLVRYLLYYLLTITDLSLHLVQIFISWIFSFLPHILIQLLIGSSNNLDTPSRMIQLVLPTHEPQPMSCE